MTMNFFISQLKLNLTRKNAVLVYGLILVLVIMNYLQYVFECSGYDLLQMYHPMTLGLISEYNNNGSFLLVLYPFLVVLVAGWAYFDDYASGEELFWVTRVGKKQYYAGKILAVFFAAFIVFTVPLFLEMALDIIAFPAAATGNPNFRVPYDELYMEEIRGYMWAALFIKSRYLYVVFRILLWGVVSGILTAFTVGLSYLRIFKYRVLLFLPVYIMLNAIFYLGDILRLKFLTYYGDYLTYYDTFEKSVPAMAAVLLILILVTCGMVVMAAGKDVMNR